MKCHNCKKQIEKGNEVKLFRKPYNYFCSNKCAKRYKERKRKMLRVGKKMSDFLRGEKS